MRHGLIGAIILSLLLVGEAWPQRRHLTNEDAHHPRLHAGAHSENGADEVKVEDLASDCNGLPIEGDASGGATCGSYPSSPDAEYVVGAAHSGLTSEWVLGDDVLFRSANCTAETDKAIGAVCFQSDNAGAWRHEGSNSWIQVAAPVPGAQFVLGATNAAFSSSQVLGTDVILVSGDCTTVTGKPVGAVCLNTELTRLWRHAGSDSWSEIAPRLDIHTAYSTEIASLEGTDRFAASDEGETDTPTGYVQTSTLRNDFRPTAREEGTDVDTDPAFYDFRGSGVTVTPDGDGARVTVTSTPGTTSLPWTSITGRPDIDVGTNPGDFASLNYQFQVSSRDISSAVSPGLFIGRNTNSANQRAGYLVAQARDGTSNYLWFGNDGDVCKSTTAPNGTDSNCESVGVDPQIITMTVLNLRSAQNVAAGPFYVPIFSGIVRSDGGSASDLGFQQAFAVMNTGNAAQGTPFPAGTIEHFGFAVGTNQTGATSCTVSVTINDDGTAVLSGSVVNGSRVNDSDHVSTDTATIAGGSLLNAQIAFTNCGATEVNSLSITMNFIPG